MNPVSLPFRLLDACASTARPKIAVFRAMHLGEMLCAVPALRALRQAIPSAHITLIGLPWAASFARRFSHYIDAHVDFPGFPGLPGQSVDLARIPTFMAAMQAERFDCVLQIHGSGGLSNPIVRTFGAARNAGFYRQGEYCPDPLHFMPWDENCHDILRLARLMNFLGIPMNSHDMEFPVTDADRHALRACLPEPPQPGSYVCIHPGARMPALRWPPQDFARIADTLHDAGLQVVLVGSALETAIASTVQQHMHAPALNLVGKLGVGAFSALLSQARLVVCNDTGIAHIAAALQIPSVALCCGSGARRWAPLDRHRHRSVHVASTENKQRPELVRERVLTTVRALLADTGMPFA
ncbi:ADP-heptose:LPS heptosyltransferase [Paucimonas lemoignei]|uniref:ADP-heptose:LPS heptosyltransferase n=1 Tax=Paucimonas lemoignei TaxID=29443 RepID=A0A4R3HQT0_PAULE|nr:glycosyltransferase family 9 protein [Paucimonas lemoignei]TCS34703.1 ADP-heptose:LPS heptosyltransferase [Paucimonas lemoignei]